MKSNWQQVAMVLIGIVVGGGVSAAVGSAHYQKLREEVNHRLDVLDDSMIPIMVEIGKMQAVLENLEEDIAEIKEEKKEKR